MALEGPGLGEWSPAPVAPTSPNIGAAGRTAQQSRGPGNSSQHLRGGEEFTTSSSRLNSPSGKSLHLGEKHNRGGKIQRCYKENEALVDTRMNFEEGRPSDMTLQSIRGAAPTEVIPQTQLAQINDRSKVYKDILASIGLENPTTSQEIRNKYNEMDHNLDQGF